MTREEADKLDAIAMAMQDLTIAFREHDAREESCRIRVHEMAIELWGNGKPGLKTRVDRIEQRAQLMLGLLSAAAAVVGFLLDRVVTKWLG
jgi:hypothetical protein